MIIVQFTFFKTDYPDSSVLLKNVKYVRKVVIEEWLAILVGSTVEVPPS